MKKKKGRHPCPFMNNEVKREIVNITTAWKQRLKRSDTLIQAMRV
jgi:hypothetical protein